MRRPHTQHVNRERNVRGTAKARAGGSNMMTTKKNDTRRQLTREQEIAKLARQQKQDGRSAIRQHAVPLDEDVRRRGDEANGGSQARDHLRR
ncbi:MAG: hypothetical protein JW940_19275 [Polyangiaceae bacterium]|nr:hypothetical protein [Polyangiaceae bacterium]